MLDDGSGEIERAKVGSGVDVVGDEVCVDELDVVSTLSEGQNDAIHRLRRLVFVWANL